MVYVINIINNNMHVRTPMNSHQEEDHEVDRDSFRLSSTITLKDLVSFISLAVTLTIAWSTFETKIVVIEKDLSFQTSTIERLQSELERVKEQQNNLIQKVNEINSTLRFVKTQ